MTIIKISKIKKLNFLLIALVSLQITFAQDVRNKKLIENKWKPLKTTHEFGLHGERINLWRQNRLKFMLYGDFLINGFEHRPGSHPWQGEHIGKWLHATTLSIQNQEEASKEDATQGGRSENTLKSMKLLVERLLATQLPNGYMGTYTEKNRFMEMMEKESMKSGWDVWVHRYNLYGLLTYEKFYPNPEVLDACKKIGDLLIETFGEGKADITMYGTRQGISSTTLLESIVMLYERTMEKKYLDFAEHIVKIIEQNDKHRLMGNMLEHGSVVYSGDGKAYQLMANLLGYLGLYRCTGKEKYLTTVQNGWKDIKQNHILATGGPWSRQTSYNGNKECFAHQEAFHPEKIFVEGCSDTTWIQLNIHLHELTGEAKYFNEAEITLINEVYRHQDMDGYKFAYYTTPNENKTQSNPFYHCCASSEPRGMEMYSDNLVGVIDGNLSVNSLFSASIRLTEEFGGGKINILGNFPHSNGTTFELDLIEQKQFTLEFRVPANTLFKSVAVNGRKVEAIKNERGKYEITGKWKKGDQVEINHKFELKAHKEIGEGGKKWVAFTYGPLTLAEKLKSKNDFSKDFDHFNRIVGGKKPINKAEPFKNLDETNMILEKLTPVEGGKSRFKISETEIELIPYHETASNYSGPRTYFSIGEPD